MNDTTLILLLSSFVYIFRIIFFIGGFFREYKRTTNNLTGNYTPKVSVIIPAKDEENNIEDLLNTIKDIDYPKDKLEVIVVNDRSTDKTAEIVGKFKTNQTKLKLINIKNDTEKYNIPGKAGAVHVGVEASSGELIFVTDADCRIRPQWLKKIVPIYKDKNTGFVTSFTNVTGNRLFDKIQAVEWIYMHTMAMGGVGMNQPLGCYGNNLTFRKEYYDSFGGYKSIPFSVTEDLALQKAFYKNNFQVHYCIDKDILVDTKPCQNLKEYFAQHHRWARGGLNLGWRAAIFVLSSFCIWAGMLFFLISGHFSYLLFLIFIRIVGDTLLLLPPLLILKKTKLLFHILLSVPFFLIVELTIPFAILNKKVVWKDQVFKTT